MGSWKNRVESDWCFVKWIIIFIFILNNLTTTVQSNKIKTNLNRRHPILIVISYDGFRHDYVNKEDTPHLNSVRSKGVSVPWMMNQFLTNTFPNHHSIATGLHIESHGIVANYFFDPLYNKTLLGYNDDAGFWNYSTSVVPAWVLNEWAQDGRHSGVMMWPGSGEPYGENETLSTYIKKYNGTYPFENRVDDVISWITNEKKPANLVYLYFQEPDSTAHSFGPNSKEVKKTIQRMDDVTGYLLEKLDSLDILDKVNLMFLSDHGMQEVHSTNYIINIDAIVDNSRYYQHGGSPVLQIRPVIDTPEETEAIYRAFKDASKNSNFSVYMKNDTKLLKPHWHYSQNRRIMPILLIADLGFVFNEYSKQNILREHPTGLHGYSNEYREMNPYFMAIGPLFKSGGAVQKPFENVDIFPLVCHIMGFHPPGNNGSIHHILPIMRHLHKQSGGSSSSSWIESTAGQILGIVLGVFVLVVVVGFLILRGRKRRMASVELH